MQERIGKLKAAAFSATARDTYTLFFGNTLSAFLGFVYTLFIARALTVSDFGIFSAVVNLVVILTSLTDVGISTGVVNFVSAKRSEGKIKESEEYIKAATLVRLVITIIVSVPFFLFAGYLAPKLLATSNPSASAWVAATTISLALPLLLPFVLQAQKKFVTSIVADNTLYLSRLLLMFLFMYFLGLTINNSMFSYALGGVFGSFAGIVLLKWKFLFRKPSKKIYKNLLHFSGWIGVNRVVSSISGRLDVAMLAVLAGASETGLYSIPARLAGFVTVLTASYSGVLAPRFAGFRDHEKEKDYIKKASIALIPISAGLVFWIIIAKPFITILFGEKYLPAVPIFQCLTAATIPFLLTAVPVTAIIYAMKKTVYIGAFSFFQLAAIFLLNLYFIPKYGPVGPTLSLGIVNLILAVYTWYFVIKYYWFPR